jgi:hypothetical protein
MRGQRVPFIGGQGPVSAPALRSLAPGNNVWALAGFSVPANRKRLESLGVTCIRHDILDPVDGLPADFDSKISYLTYIYYTHVAGRRQQLPDGPLVFLRLGASMTARTVAGEDTVA